MSGLIRPRQTTEGDDTTKKHPAIPTGVLLVVRVFARAMRWRHFVVTGDCHARAAGLTDRAAGDNRVAYLAPGQAALAQFV